MESHQLFIAIRSPFQRPEPGLFGSTMLRESLKSLKLEMEKKLDVPLNSMNGMLHSFISNIIKF